VSNHLINEKSAYLLDHAENPIDWYPWGEAAFEKARSEDKPVFLSIGYSACHWCHVMAEESFADAAVAEILNKNYVAIKVDREERGDVDSVYMRVCQAMGMGGGWPLNIIMTAGQVPFFAATYIPKESHGRQIGLIALLDAIAEKWRSERHDLLAAGNSILKRMRIEERLSDRPMNEDIIESAAEQFAASYDSECGGFGRAPKFPAAHNLLFLLRYAEASGKKELRAQVEHSLTQMYRGGIFDHFGGGFARYSTDREWLAPHFEKMLYDNALLALAYTEAWQNGHLPLYRSVAERTIDYALRELRDECGGFYSAQDADVDGIEGLYYLFSPQEVKKLLGEDEGRHFCECYDITDEGNFHGRSIPNLLLNSRYAMLPEGYAQYREKLSDYRAGRYPLRTDKKMLTSSNALMLMTLARAATAFNSSRYLAAAQKLAAFLAAQTKDGKLYSCRYGDSLSVPAQLEDYAFYALGLLELYRADYNAEHISLAAKLAEEISEHFSDERGGFFKTANNAEKLVLRPKELYDGATPSGNTAAAVLFSQLWRFTAELKWREAAEKQLDYVCAAAKDYPAGIAFALTAAMDFVYPTKELVCVSIDEEEPELLAAVTARYSPELTILLKTPQNASTLEKAAPFTAVFTAKDGKSTFYMCSGGVCQMPIN